VDGGPVVGAAGVREVSSETDAHPEGIALHVLYSAVPLQDEEGSGIGALEVITDQTVVHAARSVLEVTPDRR